MRNIQNDIDNNSYKRVYLLYGEESYLKTQFKNKFIKAICSNDTMNYSYFEGKGFDVKEFIGIAETLPFFAELRLIVIENSTMFKSASDELVEYIDKIPETTTVVFVENEVDKRNKLFKKVKDIGYVSEMGRQTNDSLKRWIIGLLKKNNKNITEPTLNLFIERVGVDMESLYNEIEKLICYIGDREIIEANDVLEISTEQITSKVFDLVDAIGYKNQTKALEIYFDLIANKESPLLILYMLSRQFNILLKVYELKKEGLDSKSIAEKTALAPFVVTKTLKQIGNFNYDTIKKALEESVDFEEKIKVGSINEKAAVEIIIIKYSSKS